MKPIKYVIIFCSLLIFTQACKKESLSLGDFAPVRNSIRAWNEVTNIAEMYNYATQPGLLSILKNQNQFTKVNPILTGDSGKYTLNFGSKDTINKDRDNRFRSGKIIYTILNPLTDTNNFIYITFNNYFVNNVQITGTLTLKESGKASGFEPSMFKLKITGNLTFTLANGNTFSVQPNLLQDYVGTTIWYTGKLGGIDVEGKNFTCEVENDIFKTTSNECNVVLYKGRYKLISENKIGKVWFGYKSQCDEYGFAEWLGKKYNFWLRDY